MQTNTKSPYLRLLAVTLSVASVSVIGSCDTFNPFNPIAAVDVLAVSFVGASTTGSSSSGSSGSGTTGTSLSTLTAAGIVQTIPVDANGLPTTGLITYTSSDPIVTLRDRPSAPEVRFQSVTVVFDIPGLQIPQQTFLYQFLLAQAPATTNGSLGGISAGQQVQIPILSIYADQLTKAIYPNDQSPIVRSGAADVYLSGQDSNNNNIVTEFTTPLQFRQATTTSTSASASPAVTTPTAVPSTSAVTSAVPTVSVSASPAASATP
jgi:hypothetical protein